MSILRDYALRKAERERQAERQRNTPEGLKQRRQELRLQIIALREKIDRDATQVEHDCKRLRGEKAKKYQQEAISMHAAPSSLNPVMARGARKAQRQAKEQLQRAKLELVAIDRQLLDVET